MLFSTCTSLGAISVGASDKEIEILRKFGEIYGICFQIRDDMFDYISSEKEIGKPVGNDIRDGKITLPLLHALNKVDNSIKEQYIRIIKEQDFSQENIEKLISFAKENGGIEYAEKCIQHFIKEGKETLKLFPESEIKDSLLMNLNFTMERKK